MSKLQAVTTYVERRLKDLKVELATESNQQEIAILEANIDELETILSMVIINHLYTSVR